MTLADEMRQQAGRALLWWRSQAGAIQAALSEMPLPAAASLPTAEQVTVSAVQLRFELTDSAAAYARKIAALVGQAVLEGAQVVCFPEYTGACLLGLLPGIEKLTATVSETSTQTSGGLAAAMATVGISPGDLFRYVGPAAWRVFNTTASIVARRCNVYLMAGTLPVPSEDGTLLNTAYLYGPDGEFIGQQAKLHCYTAEAGWLDVGHELHVFDLPFARVAMPVCMDYTYWETTRLAALRQVDLLLNPAADDHGESPWLQARGIRNRVQEAAAYGVQTNMVARQFGLGWCGRSAIFAPLGLLPPEQGDVVAQADDPWDETVVTATLDLAALRQWRAGQTREFNAALYRRYLPALYAESTVPQTRLAPNSGG